MGSNEEYWKEYQKEPAKSFKKARTGSSEDYWFGQDHQKARDGLENARLVQSGIDPNESFNFVRGGLIVGCAMFLIGVILYVVLT